MPQMAPIMWTPMFILIVSLMFMVKSNIYFIGTKSSLKLNLEVDYLKANWLW